MRSTEDLNDLKHISGIVSTYITSIYDFIELILATLTILYLSK